MLILRDLVGKVVKGMRVKVNERKYKEIEIIHRRSRARGE
jgi:hypothetical protein